MDYKIQKEAVAYYMRRLYSQHLTTCSGGNISYKINDDAILITPSQLDKARLQPEQIRIVNIKGENLTPELKLSIETPMHLKIYKKRPDVKAVIHAHPALATSFSVMNKTVNSKLTGEARLILGNVLIAPYALMGSEKLADIVSDTLLKTDVALMQNHGVICVAKSLLMAFNKIEVLENAAKIDIITEILKKKNEISEQDLNDIDKMI